MSKDLNRGSRWMWRSGFAVPAAVLGIATAMFATPVAAQTSTGPATELGIDAGATFGLGNHSSIDFALPGSRFRMGFFQPGSRISFEPALGFGYHKVQNTDGVFSYDLQLGALYHFSPMSVNRSDGTTTMAMSTYARPFVGLTGYSSGSGGSDHEVSLGGGLGVMVPWRTELSWRLEANLAYGFTNKAARLGLLAGLSYFPR